MSDTPLYYRFAYSPRTDEVALGHNKETHPAKVRSHGDIAREVSDADAVHGYVYRIGGGWRIFGYDHKPLTDPYVKRKVEKAIARSG